MENKLPDAEVIEFACLVLEKVVEPFYFLSEVIVIAFKVLQLALALAVGIDIIFEFADDILELLVLFDLVATAFLHGLLLLLKVAVVGEGSLRLVVSVLPVLDFAQSRLEDAIYAVVLDLEVVDLGLVAVELVLHVLVLGQLGLPLPHLLLPLVNLVQLAPQDTVQPVQFLGSQVQLVAQLLVVVL
jgi:hypothetical protein